MSGQVPAPVRPPGQDGQLAEQFPFELGAGPGGVLPLHLGDGGAHDLVPLAGGGQSRLVRCGVRIVVRLDRFGEPFERLYLLVAGLADPRGQLSLGGLLLVAALLACARLVLGGAGLDGDPLAELEQRLPARRVPEHLGVLRDPLREFRADRADRGAPATECVDGGLLDAADLEPVPVRPLDQRETQPGQLLGFPCRGVRAGGEPFGPQRPAVERPPQLILPVGALCPVEDGDLHVKLGSPERLVCWRNFAATNPPASRTCPVPVP
jgi:hypothetical protein